MTLASLILKKSKDRLKCMISRLFGYKPEQCLKVNLSWLLQLHLKNKFSNKIRIGFGPVLSGENDLQNRKWEIDPFVNYINSTSDKFVADIFFEDSDLSRFDLVVLVKEFMDLTVSDLERLKQSGTRICFNTSDNVIYQNSYRTESRFMKMMDGIIVENPLTLRDVKAVNDNVTFIRTPIISKRYKQNYEQNGVVTILWEGYLCNISPMEKFNAIVKRVSKEVQPRIQMIYHANTKAGEDGIIKYVPWDLANWESMRVGADIAVVIKPIDDPVQQRKPPAKVQTYMASGLPVICTPSEADRLCIEHGRTGLFAYTDDQWYDHLRLLVENAELRQRIGQAARRSILDKASIEKVGRQYTDFFDRILVQRKAA